jgi:hypothetical protein
MSHPFRLAVCAMLALMQMLAPWVHAHTGVEKGGLLHMPGLEFLAGGETGCAVLDAQPGGTDLIVSVQAGPWNGPESIRFAPDRLIQPYPPPVIPALLPKLPGASLTAAEASPSPVELFRHDARPRAPPSSSFHV